MPKPNTAPQGRKSLMYNRVVSILMALACGLATWLVVTIYIDPQGSTTIRDVPINYANSATTYTNQGLDIVERPDISGVTVRVEGNITSIGKMTSSDIMVYPSYSGVSGAGKVTLRLQARVTNTTDYSGNIKCKNPTIRSTSCSMKSAKKPCPSRWMPRLSLSPTAIC